MDIDKSFKATLLVWEDQRGFVELSRKEMYGANAGKDLLKQLNAALESAYVLGSENVSDQYICDQDRKKLTPPQGFSFLWKKTGNKQSQRKI